MIQNQRALEETYVPQELHHRDGELAVLTSALNPITKGRSGEDVILSGPSGTGKTTLARFVVQELEKEVPDVRWGYVNCLNEGTRAGVFYTLLKDSTLATPPQKQGFMPSTFSDRIRDLDGQFVAIVDEVDTIESQFILHELYDIPNLTMLLATANEDVLFADLDQRVQSRLRAAMHVRLDRYSHAELSDILWSRIDVGLVAGSVETEAVSRIADIAAGDARLAITHLRQAVERVDGLPKRGKVTLEDVELVTDEAKQAVQKIQVEQLGEHKKALYEIIEECGRVPASDMHTRYEERVSDPKSKSTRRRYLRSLEHYGLIEIGGQGRGRFYEISSPD